MSKFGYFLALFQPTLTTAAVCAGVYLLLTSGATAPGSIGAGLVLAGILSIVFYAKRLHGLPEARLINSPETDVLRVYMRGGLIAAFIPTAISLALVGTLFGIVPNDGVAVITFIGCYAAFLLLPFVFYPAIVFITLFGAGTDTEAERIWGVLLVVCFITRTVMQSMCFIATNKRIDYDDSRVGGIFMTMPGTVNIIFWLGNLSKVRKFAKIEIEKGIAAQ